MTYAIFDTPAIHGSPGKAADRSKSCLTRTGFVCMAIFSSKDSTISATASFVVRSATIKGVGPILGEMDEDPRDVEVIARYIVRDDSQAWLSGTEDAEALYAGHAPGWRARRQVIQNMAVDVAHRRPGVGRCSWGAYSTSPAGLVVGGCSSTTTASPTRIASIRHSDSRLRLRVSGATSEHRAGRP